MIEAPLTSSGNILKSDRKVSRSLSEDRIKFVEEEYDFLSRELAAWLSDLIGEEISMDLEDSLRDGINLCRIVQECLPTIKITKYHEKANKTSFYAKDNIAIFNQSCQAMGMNKNDCISASMFEHGERRLIVNCLLRFAIMGVKYGLKPISVIHSERLQSFMNEFPDVNIPHEEIGEEEKKVEKVVEHVWNHKDDRNVIMIIIMMIIVLAIMIYLSYILVGKMKNTEYLVCNKHTIKLNPVSQGHYTSSSIKHFHQHLQILLLLMTNPLSSIDP